LRTWKNQSIESFLIHLVRLKQLQLQLSSTRRNLAASLAIRLHSSRHYQSVVNIPPLHEQLDFQFISSGVIIGSV